MQYVLLASQIFFSQAAKKDALRCDEKDCPFTAAQAAKKSSNVKSGTHIQFTTAQAAKKVHAVVDPR